MAEHRIGLQPMVRRVWTLRGQRPMVQVHHRYAWSDVYGFVHPTSGRTVWLLMPTVSIEAFNLALQEFARDLGPDKLIWLLVDGAGWHRSPPIHAPPGLRLYFLPPYSPELQPAEHLWPLTNQPLINQWFVDLDHLQAVQAQHCNALPTHLDLIRSTPNFHWWPHCA
jgi:transposase